jgi:hypothetical protein
MAKSTQIKAPIERKTKKGAPVKHPEILRQMREAAANPAAAAMGLAMGGVVPGLGYEAAHVWIPGLLARSEPLAREAPLWQIAVPFVALAAILLFSAKTVFIWSHAVFRDPWKAAGMVVILEAVMLFNPCWWVSSICLGFLVGINAVATAYNVSA